MHEYTAPEASAMDSNTADEVDCKSNEDKKDQDVSVKVKTEAEDEETIKVRKLVCVLYLFINPLTEMNISRADDVVKCTLCKIIHCTILRSGMW